MFSQVLHVDDSHISTFSNECYEVVSTFLKKVEILPKCKYESTKNVFETLPRILHWISIDVLLDHFHVDLPFNPRFSKGWTAMKQQVLSFPTSYFSWKVKSILIYIHVWSWTKRCWSPTLSTVNARPNFSTPPQLLLLLLLLLLPRPHHVPINGHKYHNCLW